MLAEFKCNDNETAQNISCDLDAQQSVEDKHFLPKRASGRRAFLVRPQPVYAPASLPNQVALIHSANSTGKCQTWKNAEINRTQPPLPSLSKNGRSEKAQKMAPRQ